MEGRALGDPGVDDQRSIGPVALASSKAEAMRAESVTSHEIAAPPYFVATACSGPSLGR
jgi:hypothetical protein